MPSAATTAIQRQNGASASASASASDENARSEENDREGFFSRIFLAPLIFVSFLFSFALVDGYSRRRRRRGGQDPLAPAQARARARAGGEGGGAWLLRWTGVHRHVARREMDRAFELRARVAGGMVLGALGLACAVLAYLWKVWTIS
ncbi:MAG: hypothetical protein M1826_003404 [Phylliscum demangeonii]|nr:MAG: hypothetical protein M1826_003404 [Phylliscum demangeonii]